MRATLSSVVVVAVVVIVTCSVFVSVLGYVVFVCGNFVLREVAI